MKGKVFWVKFKEYDFPFSKFNIVKSPSFIFISSGRELYKYNLMNDNSCINTPI